jgi:hypothetical protein
MKNKKYSPEKIPQVPSTKSQQPYTPYYFVCMFMSRYRIDIAQNMCTKCLGIIANFKAASIFHFFPEFEIEI